MLVVTRTPPQTRNGRCPVAEQTFGMCNIHINTTVFELSLSVKKRKKERKKLNKIEIFMRGFLSIGKTADVSFFEVVKPPVGGSRMML